MTVQDSFLNSIANAFSGNTFVIPQYLAIGTTAITSVGTTDTAINGEIGARVLLTAEKQNNVLNYSCVRSPAAVVNTASGDYLGNTGLTSASTLGTLLTHDIIGGLTQTTGFSVEFLYQFVVDRA